MKKYIAMFVLVLSTSFIYSAKVGLCFAATNKYTQFIQPFLDSCRKHFLKNHEVTYFVFTDRVRDVAPASDVVIVPTAHLPWPYVTLFRFENYYKAAQLFDGYDYVFASDVDMLFVNKAGDEILGDLVGTQHPYFQNMIRNQYTYEENSVSTACITRSRGERYFAGGFYGGKTMEFLKLVHTCAENIITDLKKNFIAVWHDESHINRYFVDNPPTKILSSAYCYPECKEYFWLPKILMALEKNKAEVRS